MDDADMTDDEDAQDVPVQAAAVEEVDEEEDAEGEVVDEDTEVM